MDIQQREITHIRFYMNMIDELRLALNDEQMGCLFFAVADYAKTGEKKVVSPELIFPYSRCCYNIDRMRMGL